jgi:hypothetical protein
MCPFRNKLEHGETEVLRHLGQHRDDVTVAKLEIGMFWVSVWSSPSGTLTEFISLSRRATLSD